MSSEITLFFENSIFFYALAIMLAYVVLGLLAVLAINNHFRKGKSVNFEHILRSSIAPKIAVIAPAYNESATIVENIRSLLSLKYNNYEIVIVNDGSTDDCLEKMIKAYDLERSDQPVYSELSHAPIRGIYKSKNKAFRNLKVIDKENGGKADSLNAGINYSNARVVANIDVDCIIEDDALLRMVEPFLQETDRTVIATGGVVGIANNCTVKDGRIIDIKLPKERLALFQTVEYFRAFLLGRMGWSRLNGLFLISGAFGLFDKQILIDAGGYNTKTVGEDMELVVRMRRLMHDRKEEYVLYYIPDPLCWTEVPKSRKVLSRQRNRWTRGTIETLWIHRKMMFNPKYGVLGMASYPFWLLFEWLAPIIEFLGIIYFVVFAIFGWVNWQHSLLLIAMVYTFAVCVSWFTIFVEALTYRKYKGFKSLFKLQLIAMLEPILFHPFVIFASIKGNWDKFVLRKNTWGVQVRDGFNATETAD